MGDYLEEKSEDPEFVWRDTNKYNDVVISYFNDVCQGQGSVDRCYNNKKYELYNLLVNAPGANKQFPDNFRMADSLITPAMVKRVVCKRYLNGQPYNKTKCYNAGLLFGTRSMKKSKRKRSRKSRKSKKRKRRASY